MEWLLSIIEMCFEKPNPEKRLKKSCRVLFNSLTNCEMLMEYNPNDCCNFSEQRLSVIACSVVSCNSKAVYLLTKFQSEICNDNY